MVTKSTAFMSQERISPGTFPHSDVLESLYPVMCASGRASLLFVTLLQWVGGCEPLTRKCDLWLCPTHTCDGAGPWHWFVLACMEPRAPGCLRVFGPLWTHMVHALTRRSRPVYLGRVIWDFPVNQSRASSISISVSDLVISPPNHLHRTRTYRMNARMLGWWEKAI